MNHDTSPPSDWELDHVRDRLRSVSVRLDAVAIQLCDALDERNELIADILIAAGRRGVSELDWTDLSRRWRLSVLDETTATLRGIHRLAGAALGA